MKKTRLFGVLVLAVLFCSVLSFRAAPTRTAAQIPRSILVYTQYADTAVGGEFAHTIDAINDTYGALGTAFTYENLTDYNDLATEITGHNVFLILEQEDASDIATMETIGTAWATTLQNFVAGGGVVIVTDYRGVFIAPSLYILNETGLMTFREIVDTYHDTLTSASVVAPTDPLATGVAALFTSSNGMLSVNTSEVTVVVEDNNNNPVVIHKVWGSGHIVYCGFDLYHTNTNLARILGNAVGLQPIQPPIPGFPIAAVAIGLVLCLGLGVVMRRRRKVN